MQVFALHVALRLLEALVLVVVDAASKVDAWYATQIILKAND